MTADLTILQMNSMYWAFDDNTPHGNEADVSLSWLKYQLNAARFDGRKVIILDHIYAGARYHDGQQLWDSDQNDEYFQTLRDYRDVVVIEVAGHDHYPDVRYHSTRGVAGLKDESGSEEYFHN